MKRIVHWVAVLSAVLLAGCGGRPSAQEEAAAPVYSDTPAADGYIYAGGKQSPTLDVQEIALTMSAKAKLRDDVKILRATDISRVASDEASITFDKTPDVTVGSVFIFNGGAYKVLDVNDKTVAWKPPTLKEVFATYDFRFEKAPPEAQQSARRARAQAAGATASCGEDFVMALLGRQAAECTTIVYSPRVTLFKDVKLSSDVIGASSFEAKFQLDVLAQFTGRVAYDGINQVAESSSKLYYLLDTQVPLTLKTPELSKRVFESKKLPLANFGGILQLGLGADLSVYAQGEGTGGDTAVFGKVSTGAMVGGTFRRNADGTVGGSIEEAALPFRFQVVDTLPAPQDIKLSLEAGVKGFAGLQLYVLEFVSLLDDTDLDIAKIGATAKLGAKATVSSGPQFEMAPGRIPLCTVIGPKVSLSPTLSLFKGLLNLEREYDYEMSNAKFGTCAEAASKVAGYHSSPVRANEPVTLMANLSLRPPGGDVGGVDPSSPDAPEVTIVQKLGDKSCTTKVRGSAVGAQCSITPDQEGEQTVEVTATIDAPAAFNRPAWKETFTDKYTMVVGPARIVNAYGVQASRSTWLVSDSPYSIRDAVYCAFAHRTTGYALPTSAQACYNAFPYYATYEDGTPMPTYVSECIDAGNRYSCSQSSWWGFLTGTVWKTQGEYGCPGRFRLTSASGELLRCVDWPEAVALMHVYVP